jgi:hypothetical protein
MVALDTSDTKVPTEQKPVGQDEDGLPSSSHVASEKYPISQPLATILRAVVPINNGNDGNDYGSDNFEVLKESVENALHSLIRNCFVAIDAMYFYT